MKSIYLIHTSIWNELESLLNFQTKLSFKLGSSALLFEGYGLSKRNTWLRLTLLATLCVLQRLTDLMNNHAGDSRHFSKSQIFTQIFLHYFHKIVQIFRCYCLLSKTQCLLFQFSTVWSPKEPQNRWSSCYIWPNPIT